jgi:glycosyltransferase involved in cell wall biosynthesis
MTERPHVVYVSYDGAAEPLGRSQIVAYLERLTDVANITLISFEKPGDDTGPLAERLAAAGITWLRHRYHGSPPVASTWWDVRAGARAIRRAHRSRPVQIVHTRSYVPALMARQSGVLSDARFLFDIRGFWADERVEGGIWRKGTLYRLAKRYEAQFFAAADAVVTLTEASVPWIRERVRSDVSIEVIPTCVDLDRYRGQERRPDGPRLIWSGSVGTWYRFDLAVRMAKAADLPLTALTRQQDLARQALGDLPGEVREVASEAVPAELHRGDLGLCLVRSSFSKKASAPTRFAEYLASGMPVAVTADVGDLESIVEDERVGLVVRGEDDRSLAQAGARQLEKYQEPGTSRRCREVAAGRFGLSSGVQRYAALYEKLGSAASPGSDPAITKSS